MIPSKLNKEGWRDWRDDVESYMDSMTLGMKEVYCKDIRLRYQTKRAELSIEILHILQSDTLSNFSIMIFYFLEKKT